MSAVYKAYDPNLKRVVAIKMIHTHLANDPKFLVRFEEEATAVAQLRHPHIVQVYDFNHDGDLYYMVQEFVAGETLQERLRRLNKAARRMSVTDGTRYTLHMCDATGYAHRRGMIHRDIKPANIMLDIHDQGILMDFGIVKITGGERHTATGAVVGTALYMPPELIRGEIPDPRSDIYSLGVTLFEMISGHPPFEADLAMSVMMMHVNDPPPDMRQLRPEVPEPVIAVVEKSLAKNRADRYPSMDEMANALKSALDALGIGGGAAAAPGEPPASHTPAPVVAAGIATVADKTLVEPASEAALTADKPPLPVQDKTALDSPVQSAILGSTIAEAASPGGVAGGDPPAVPPPTPPAAPGSGSGSSGGDSPAPPAASQTGAKGGMNKLTWIVAAAVVLLLVVVGGFLVSRLGGSGQGTPTLEAASSNQPSAVALLPTTVQTSTSTPKPSQTPTVTPTPPPTSTPTTTLSPTPTIPAGVQYSFIKGITIDNQNRYVVDYETFEYTEKLPAAPHVHFFFNTVPPEQAGNPGRGPWVVYGGPRPFIKYSVRDRPKFATQLCILVANHDHSVQLNSGNCVVLPDVPVAAPVQDMSCLAGPDSRFPPVTSLTAGQFVLVMGISADEGWWNVANPANTKESCWLLQNQTTFSGDVNILPLVESPPLPTGVVAESLSVEILGITIDGQNHYVVDYVTHGFSEKIPGTHMHFFFNTVPPDLVGATGGGNRLMHGGPTPFTGYTTADRPADATELCVLVANTGHTVIPGSGNCFKLPDVP